MTDNESELENCVSNTYHPCVNDFTSDVQLLTGFDLNILQLNVCIDSCVNKFNQFVGLIHLIGIDVDVIVIGETWLKYGHSSLFNIPGYTAYHSLADVVMAVA